MSEPSEKNRNTSFTSDSRRFAEKEGFEPPEPFGSTVFKTAAIDRSAISPLQK